MTDWEKLKGRFAEATISLLQRHLAQFGMYSTTPEAFAETAQISVDDSRALLEAVIAGGDLQRDEQRKCGRCDFDLSDTDAKTACPECKTDFADRAPVTTVTYVRLGAIPRLIPWFLVVHGMNTRGEWQEELTWLVGRSYRHMVPVAIYKYGKIQPGVLFKWRQLRLKRKLIAKMNALSKQSAAAGLEGHPDVIAHSFGTWLVANALLSDSSLIIGRLIMLGSVVPPDFPWRTIVERRQIEYILNHGATGDRWVRVAQYVIPASGPGGTQGFPPPVSNIRELGLGHSDYFSPERMKMLFERVWQPFLAWSTPQFSAPLVASGPWRRAIWLTRKSTWLLAILILLSIAALGLIVVGLGLYELWHFV